MHRVRLILVGGFLGAGKTTLLARAAKLLVGNGRRVGLITNDQASDLVDTAILKREGLDVTQVAGGCFCCRFDELVSAADRLITDIRPDVLLGEPVGSCTDISATVIQPLKAFYADWFQIAPFSVLVDPVRLREILTPPEKSSLSEDVLYIFRKQLEEADLIVLNKIDLLSSAELTELHAMAADEFPDVPMVNISALNGQGVESWLELLAKDNRTGRRLPKVDYDIYADGEAALGWLNASFRLEADDKIDWRAFCLDLLNNLRAAFGARSAEIAHLKLLLTVADGSLAANVTRTDAEPTIRGDIPKGKGKGQAGLLVNARVQIDPADLRGVLESCLRETAGRNVNIETTTIKSFSPARPEPIHRFDSPV